MKKTKVVWIFFVCLVVFAGFLIYFKAKGRNSQENKSNILVFTVKKGDIESTVSAVGSILSTDTRDISVTPGSTVQKILCVENQSVKQGDLLFVLTNESVNLDLEKANLVLSQQQTQVLTLQNQQKELILRAPVAGIVRSINASLQDSVTPAYGMPGTSPLVQLEDTSIMKFTIYANPADAGKNMKGMMPSSQKINVNFQGVGIRECIISSANVSSQGSSVTFQVLKPEGLTFGSFYTISIPMMLGMEIPISSPVQVSGNTVLVSAKQSGTVSAIRVKVGDKVIPNQVLIETRSDTLTNQIQLANLSVKSAQLDVKNKKKIVEDLTVKAPIDGVVYNIQIKEGSFIGSSLSKDQGLPTSSSVPQNLAGMIKSQGTQSNISLGSVSSLSSGVTIATIENQTSRKVSITIDELDIARIKVGQKAKITLDAFKDRIFSGHISSISAKGIIQNGYSTFQADISIDGSEKLLTGMSATVSILSDSKKDILLLPIDAILSKNERRYVLVSSDQGMIEKDIRVGIVNEDYAEIVQGLKEGDKVLLPVQDSNLFNRTSNTGAGTPRFPMMPGRP